MHEQLGLVASGISWCKHGHNKSSLSITSEQLQSFEVHISDPRHVSISEFSVTIFPNPFICWASHRSKLIIIQSLTVFGCLEVQQRPTRTCGNTSGYWSSGCPGGEAVFSPSSLSRFVQSVIEAALNNGIDSLGASNSQCFKITGNKTHTKSALYFPSYMLNKFVFF